MKLYQALKLKKKIASDISKLWTKLRENNSVIKGEERNYDPKEIMDEILKKTEYLIRLKINIQKANEPILDKIYRIAELKSQVDYLRTVSTKKGIETYRDYGNTVSQEYETIYDRKQIDELTLTLETSISKIQDELEQYNFNTDIED